MGLPSRNNAAWVSPIGEYLLPAGQPWRAAGVVASGEIDYFANFHQEKFAKLFMTIAAELWLRGRIDTLETVFRLRPETLLFG